MEGEELSQIDLSDEVLIARVAEHDVAAFTVLYERYARPIYAMAAHMLGSATTAEDVLQEVFLRLWSKASQFNEQRGLFKGWFLTIARHYVLDELRSRSQQQRFMAAEEIDRLLGARVDPNVDVAEQVWLRERNDALLRALKSLPAEQRRVLVLAYFGGFSQSSLAKYLGWPLGSVKKRIRLGLQKLRAYLMQEEGVAGSQDESMQRRIE